MITVLCLPGTSETDLSDVDTNPSGMLKNVTDLLDPARFECIELPYNASYGYPEAYGDSRDQAVNAVVDWCIAHDGPIVLLGYSQGAVVCGDAANRLRQNSEVELLGVALLADGCRHRDQGRKTNGYGIAGERYVFDDRYPVWQIVAEGDPICNLPKDNALRWIADVSEYMGRDLRKWFQNMLKKAQDRQFQEWNGMNLASWIWAIGYARGYLVDGRHTWHYVADGHTAELAALINTLEE